MSDSNSQTTENISCKTDSLRELLNLSAPKNDSENTSKTDNADNVLPNKEPYQNFDPLPPKPGQKYWLSAEAKKRKNEYMREYYLRKKASLLQLQEHQITPRDFKLLLANDQVASRHLESDGDYLKFIEELLGTLLDNKILKDYALSP